MHIENAIEFDFTFEFIKHASKRMNMRYEKKRNKPAKKKLQSETAVRQRLRRAMPITGF